MDNTLNYNIEFNSDAEKIAASIERLDTGINKAQNHAVQFGNKFSSALDKVQAKLSGIRLNSFIQNVQSASQGLNSMAAPGLKLSSSLADLSAITDVTGQGLKEIEGYARQNAKTFGGDAAAGVESYKLILSQLNPEIAKAPRALQAMGQHVSTLSKTMGGDTAAATEVLTTAMNQYQISTRNPIQASKEMSNMMNIMAAGAKEGSAELPQIKSALEQSGLAAKTANVSFAETNSYIQLLDKSGKKGASGGVALRNVMASLAQGRFLPRDVRKELAAAGVDINTLTDRSLSLSDRLKPLKNIMHDQALVTKMFGKENSNAAIAMISGIAEAEKLTVAITGTNTAYDQAAIVMDSPAEKSARLKAKIDNLKISMFNATGGTLGYAAELGSLAFDISNLIPIFSGFATVIKYVTSAEKMQALWAGIVSGATSAWTVVQWSLNAALTANPIGLIVVAVAALGAGIAWVISKTEGWGEAWKHTVNYGKLVFKTFGEVVRLHFLTVVNGIMIGINKIKSGWIKFQEVMGIGNSSANQKRLAEIAADTEARKKAIIDQAKVVVKTGLAAAQEYGKAAGSLKWKAKIETENEATGIVDPTTPGVFNKPTGGGANTGGSAGGKTNKAIATGGTKHNYITISLDSLIGILNIKGNDFKDSAKQMQDQSADALIRTLALATSASS